MLEIVFKNGDMVHYDIEEYTDYKYDGKYFIVIYDKQWIGFYNLDCIEYIEVDRCVEEGCVKDCPTCVHERLYYDEYPCNMCINKNRYIAK